MNKALLAKMCWRLLTRGETLWDKSLNSKYGMKETGPVFFNHKFVGVSYLEGVRMGIGSSTKGVKIEGRRKKESTLLEDTWLEDKLLKEVCSHEL